MAHPLFLIIGLVGLWIGSGLVVDGAKGLARKFGISELFIGLTIASIGTSIPEISVSLIGALDRLKGIETSGVVVGNALGSILNQVTLIIGLVGLFTVLTISKREWKREGFSLLASLGVFALVAWDGYISHLEGFFMIIVFIIYFFILISSEKRAGVIHNSKEKKISAFLMILSIIFGLAIVIFSSEFTIGGALELAEMWNIKESLIGIVIIGLGTGLPELMVSLRAVLKGSISFSVGNLLGSNVVDLLFSLGLGASISGFLVNSNIILFDLPMLILMTSVMLLLFRTNLKLERKESLILILIYITYVGIKIFLRL